MNRNRPLLLVCWLAVASTSIAHESPIDIRVDSQTGQLTTFSNNGLGMLRLLNGELYAEAPGFGVQFSANGLAAGTELELEAIGRPLFWDGTDVTSTTAVLTLENPEFDGFNVPVESEVIEYTLSANSQRQVGMTWGVYPGGNFWDAHGYYTMPIAGAVPGIYAMPVRLQAVGYQRSESLLIPLAYDPFGEWQLSEQIAAVDLLRQELVTLGVADFNNDLSVDGADLLQWQQQYGSTGPTLTADGNDDDLVDGFDLMYWQQQHGTVTQTTANVISAAVPEPGCSILFLLTLVSGSRVRTRR
ncbi:hypothetical protein [Adhaeretor mobilis]|uniref:Uncharacterized protein n=1 Tax=Adhaeretor mobilis TaxID=1930276 RepID=A0A517MPF4_9BACT|nr:hypothetical protein [Adhaeretor mobilis]QDS96765.1 hypothetical protein HG15A2_00230 [Adhaeretor mobilis]